MLWIQFVMWLCKGARGGSALEPDGAIIKCEYVLLGWEFGILRVCSLSSYVLYELVTTGGSAMVP